MKKIFYLLAYASALTFTASATRTVYDHDASSIVPGANQLILQDYSGIPEYILFEEARQPEAGNPEQWLKFAFGLGADFGLKLLSADPDQIGFVHYRYQQTVNGNPVDQSMWIVHAV